MQKSRKQQEQSQPQTARKNVPAQGVTRSAPQPLDDKVLKQISGGTSAPRGNW